MAYWVRITVGFWTTTWAPFETAMLAISNCISPVTCSEALGLSSEPCSPARNRTAPRTPFAFCTVPVIDGNQSARISGSEPDSEKPATEFGIT